MKKHMKKHVRGEDQILSCTQDDFTPLHLAQTTYNITVDNSIGSTAEDRMQAGMTYAKAIMAELKAGHICKNLNGTICVTPQCGPIPRLVLKHHAQNVILSNAK